MKKIIDGLLYNTDSAEEIYSWWNGNSTSDFKYRCKTLYRTEKGAWFMFHEGGAMTDMAVSAGNNSTCGSSDIEVISEDDAYGFLESHSDYSDAFEAIEKYFPSRIVEA